jgi:hypothetical protein
MIKKLEDEVNEHKNAINSQIKEKSEYEEKYQTSKALVTKLETLLRDKSEFQKLETIVAQLHSMIVFKSTTHLTSDDKQLVKEIFGIKVDEAQS